MLVSPTLARWSASHAVARLPRPVDEPEGMLRGHGCVLRAKGGRTAVEDDLAKAGSLERGIYGRQGWVKALCREVDGAADCAALDGRVLIF